MALCGQVVNLVGLRLLDDAGEAGRVGHVAVVKHEALVGFMRILEEMVDPVGIEERCAALDPVHDVALAQQEFGKVCTVLSSDASD